MEKPIAHKITLRLKPTADTLLQISDNNHKKEVKYYARDNSIHKLTVDHIYVKNCSNYQLFTDVLGKLNFIEWSQTVVFLLGAHNTGKTFALLELPSERDQEDKGIIFNLVERIERQNQGRNQKIKTSFRFIQYHQNSLVNLGFELARDEQFIHEESFQSSEIINFYISAEGEEQVIELVKKIAKRRNPNSNLILQIKIGIQSLRDCDTFTMSFVEINSTVISSEFNKKLIDSLVKVLQNLTRIKSMSEEKQIGFFQENTIIQLLKANFLSIKKWQIIGFVDESTPDSLSCFSVLQNLSQMRWQKALVDNLRKQVQRHEGILKRLVQKHKKVMGILAKCIDLQSTQIDRRSMMYLDCLPVQDKRGDKLRLANAKKQENQQQIQELLKQISIKQQQIVAIRDKHKNKMEEQEVKRYEAEQKRVGVWKCLKQLSNPNIKTEGINNSNNSNLFYRPSPFVKQQKQNENGQSEQSSCISRNNINSHKNLTKKFLEQAKNLTNIQLRRSYKKVTAQQQGSSVQKPQTDTRKDRIKKQEIKRQIGLLFQIISKQQLNIQQKFNQHSSMLKVGTVNRIKSRQFGIDIDLELMRECLQVGNKEAQNYFDFLKQEKAFSKFQTQLRQKQMTTQTVTTIKDI